MITATTGTLVRVNSHRARRKLHTLVGEKTPAYFSFKFNGEFRLIPSSQLEEALKITGISRTRHKLNELCQCWD